jgi:RNA polymerase sigma-70 factor (ECF subfamily)
VTLGDAFDSVLAAAKAGEQWAWERIYRELAGPVRRYLEGRGAWDAEDLTSETFLKVAGGVQGFEGGETQFRAWVFVIAHRRLIDARRSASRRGYIEWPTEDETLHRVRGGDAEDEAMSRLDSGGVERMLRGLTRDQRDVVMLRVVGGLSVAETAAALHKSEGAVKVMQHRAIAALRDSIGNVTFGSSETIQEER